MIVGILFEFIIFGPVWMQKVGWFPKKERYGKYLVSQFIVTFFRCIYPFLSLKRKINSMHLTTIKYIVDSFSIFFLLQVL